MSNTIMLLTYVILIFTSGMASILLMINSQPIASGLFFVGFVLSNMAFEYVNYKEKGSGF